MQSKTKSFLLGVFLTATATQPFWAQDPVSTRQALKNAGMTPTSVGSGYTDFGWFQGTFNLYSTKFSAKMKNGQRVEGHYLNSPWAKKGTIAITVRNP